ncbi:unnamed protein product [Medioppia subpectinata]|uniref:Uncharacterized protein n=1 Tax=Medioppia subpectinata TaxID=1979941 RepID=A0A7R9KLP5_9ACAR|nr:unnamed protein product [Medioppia subpectinata]CAG2105914.1 unnamed protein product [Medioppia subpectinata]
MKTKYLFRHSANTSLALIIANIGLILQLCLVRCLADEQTVQLESNLETIDGLDVQNPGSKRTECFEENVVKCNTSDEVCLHPQSICDGISDCPNGYDESVQLCGESSHT